MICRRFLVLLAFAGSAHAQLGNKPGHVMPPPPPEWNDIPAPVVLPEHALDTFKIDDRFRIELVASEPLIEDPVCLAFDPDGRIWACEMRGFMPDIRGTGEDQPVGNIVILEDTDGDGAPDTRSVFLDRIVLPRALALIEGGILFADHTTLFFAPDHDGKAGALEIVDAEFAPAGAVEHKPNGLMHGLDNWIYNAKSDARYRRVDDAWRKEATEFRGQWGITQDDYGRLVTNTNSNLVSAEILPPGATIRNPRHDFDAVACARTPSNAVFPIRVTCGINRGYMDGMLTPDGRLTKATAACGPVVYRGDNFPAEYYGNIFVCEPAGLLVKRLIVDADGPLIRPRFASGNSEFFASTDERSRIVNAYTAPDGTLYLVDFYRGILQHRLYISSYLHEQILHRGLDKHLGRGRIYRILSRERNPGPQPRLSGKSSIELVADLSHPNGWWRDTAQRLIVQRDDRSAVVALEALAAQNGHPLAQIHALWTLEGLGALSPDLLHRAASSSDSPKLLAQVVRLAEISANTGNAEAAFAAVRVVAVEKPRHPITDLQLTASLGRFTHPEALPLLRRTLAPHRDDKLLAHTALTGLAGREADFLALESDKETLLQQLLVAAIARGGKAELERALAILPPELETRYAGQIAESRRPKRNMIRSAADSIQFALGKAEYAKLCLACHQPDGKGQQFVAPPLVDSEWVLGDPARTIAIILDGMAGPLTVNGKTYEVPDVQPLMPGLRESPDLDDEKIAAILTYVRNSWGNAARPVSPETVARLRDSTADRAVPWTEAELRDWQVRPGSPAEENVRPGSRAPGQAAPPVSGSMP